MENLTRKNARKRTRAPVSSNFPFQHADISAHTDASLVMTIMHARKDAKKKALGVSH